MQAMDRSLLVLALAVGVLRLQSFFMRLALAMFSDNAGGEKMHSGSFFVASIILSVVIWIISLYHYRKSHESKAKKWLLILSAFTIVMIAIGIIVFITAGSSYALWLMCPCVFLPACVADLVARKNCMK
ncbi:MAG: hypothetical protein PUC60_03420 [Clostridiales bacterium]|nr:hypothetical protein [Clostridiales bacterium]